jgi:hypothetical protein
MVAKKENPAIEVEVMTEHSYQSPVSEEVKQLMMHPAMTSATTTVALGQMIAINTKPAPYHGYFLKATDAALSGWVSEYQPNYTHQFAGRAGQPGKKELGYLFHGLADDTLGIGADKFPSPMIQVLGHIGPFIEIQRGNAKEWAPPIGLDGKTLTGKDGIEIRPGDWVGEYQLGGKNPLYDHIKKQGMASLRSVYWVFLWERVNGKLQPMHRLPLTLPIHGSAARSLGMSLVQFRSQCATLFATLTEQPVKTNWSDQFYANFLFIPVLHPEDQGEGKTSLCTCVQSFNIIPMLNEEQISATQFFYAQGQLDSLMGSFAEKSDFHRIIALPPASIEATIEGDMGDEFPTAPLMLEGTVE